MGFRDPISLGNEHSEHVFFIQIHCRKTTKKGIRAGRPAGAKISACGARKRSISLIVGLPARGRKFLANVPPLVDYTFLTRGGTFARNTSDLCKTENFGWVPILFVPFGSH